jgi:anti-anti-sigma factor
VELTRRATARGMEVTVRGRLDSYWADHLLDALEEGVREGSHELVLDLGHVHYMSSAGIRVLVMTHKRLAAIQGRLEIANPSEAVVKILRLSGLSTLLLQATGPRADAPSPAEDGAREASFEREGVAYTSYDLAPGARLRGRLVGDPRRLDGCRFGAEDVTVLSIPASSTVVGVGAFGHEFAESRGRFGEFLSVAGTAAYLPTDGTGVPDYFVSVDASLPEMSLLYGVACDGPFARLVRFDAGKDAAPVSLSRLVDVCLSLGDLQAAALVLVAESAGLAGAALRRSPAAGEDPQAPFGFPDVRRWLSFSSERVYPQSVVVAVGVATRVSPGPLDPVVRPLGGDGSPAGHVHAAAFTYAPLPRGPIGLRETIGRLYETEKLQTVLHLLGDDRPISGAGESAFSRGACWIGPLDVTARSQ